MVTKKKEPKDRARSKQVSFWTFPELRADLDGAIGRAAAANERDLMGDSPSLSWVLESLVCWLIRESARDSRAAFATIKAANREWVEALDERLHAEGGDVVSHGRDVVDQPPKKRRRA